MFKKAWWLNLILALGLPAISYADGFYFGAGVGGSGFVDKTSSPFHEGDLGNIGFIGGGFLGYNWELCNQYNLGLETFINGSTDRATNRDLVLGDEWKVRSVFNYGIRVLPGYHFTPNSVSYFILGWTQGNFRSHFSSPTISVSNNFSRPGFQVGVGNAINTCWKGVSIRGDVVYNGYSSRKRDAVVLGVPTEFTSHFRSLDGIASLVYKFC